MRSVVWKISISGSVSSALCPNKLRRLSLLVARSAFSSATSKVKSDALQSRASISLTPSSKPQRVRMRSVVWKISISGSMSSALCPLCPCRLRRLSALVARSAFSSAASKVKSDALQSRALISSTPSSKPQRVRMRSVVLKVPVISCLQRAIDATTADKCVINMMNTSSVHSLRAHWPKNTSSGSLRFCAVLYAPRRITLYPRRNGTKLPKQSQAALYHGIWYSCASFDDIVSLPCSMGSSVS